MSLFFLFAYNRWALCAQQELSELMTKKGQYFPNMKSHRKTTFFWLTYYLRGLRWFKIRDSGATWRSRVCECEARRTGSIFYHCSVLSSLMDPTGAEPLLPSITLLRQGTHARSEETEQATRLNVWQIWRVLVVTPTTRPQLPNIFDLMTLYLSVGSESSVES